MKIIVFLCFFLGAPYGKAFSLMHPEYNQTKDNPSITLQGIVFVSDRQWVIWINHTRITPDRVPTWLKITKVTDSSVQGQYLYKDLWYQIDLELYGIFTPCIKEEASH